MTIKDKIDFVGKCLTSVVLASAIPALSWGIASELARRDRLEYENREIPNYSEVIVKENEDGFIEVEEISFTEIYAKKIVESWEKHEKNKVDDMFVYHRGRWQFTELGDKNKYRAELCRQYLENPDDFELRQHVEEIIRCRR